MTVISYVGGTLELPALTATRILQYSLALAHRFRMDEVTVRDVALPGTVSIMVGLGVALATRSTDATDATEEPTDLDRELDRRIRGLSAEALPLDPEDHPAVDWPDIEAVALGWPDHV